MRQGPIVHRFTPSAFKEEEISSSHVLERDSNVRIHPIWRTPNAQDADAPQYKPVKPNLTQTGRLSKLSSEASPIPPHEFDKQLRYEGAVRPKFEPIEKCQTTSTSERFRKITSDHQHQVFKPKPLQAKQCSRSKSPNNQPTQYYTATAGPPFHNQNIATETSSHMEMREATESSKRIVNISSTKKVIQFDQHHAQNTFEQHREPFVQSPAPFTGRPKLPPPPTPTKFIAENFRESDYDSEIESIKIRPMWTPNPDSEAENKRYRRVSAPTTPGRASASRTNTHFERILTPMEFDVGPVEMPSKISPSPIAQYNIPQASYKTQTLDRFRSKKKFNSRGTTSQDDINIAHSTPKYSSLRSPSGAFKEETKVSQYGELKLTKIDHHYSFIA